MIEKRERDWRKECLQRWIDEACYEVLPTAKSLELLRVIPGKNPVRVTCRPTGIEDTVSFMEAVGTERSGRIIPHAAARRLRNEEHFNEVFGRFIEAGTKKIFMVGGDGRPEGKYKKAEELLWESYGKGIKFDLIGVGGYPDGNPFYDVDPIEVLLRKQELAGKMETEMEIVTQMCFDAETLYSWIGEIRRRGVYLPVVVGILGYTKIETLFKVLPALGIIDVWAFIKSKPRLAACLVKGVLGGFDPEDLLRDLAENNFEGAGIKGISVFTLGSITKSVNGLENLGKGLR